MAKKIVYLIPGLHFPSGMERVLTLKANYLADEFGYDVTVILTEEKDKPFYYPLSPKVKTINFDLNFDRMYGLPLHRRLVYYRKRLRKFKKMLTSTLCELKPDITVSLLRRDINFLNTVPDGSVKIGEIHFNRSNYRDFNNRMLPGFVRDAVKKYWNAQLIRELKKLKKFVVLTREDEALWTELDNVTTIHNPLPFYPGPDRVSPCTAKQAIAVGRYTWQKGFDLLIEAWKRVAVRHPDWTLRIYGGGDPTIYARMVEEAGLRRTCRLEGVTDDVVGRFCESSVFVLSSRFEGFGLVVAEAMACGVPPVAFACPCGPKDIVRDGEDGLLAKNGDVEDLAEKICLLIERDELRKRMGSRAREHVRRFDIDTILQQWRQLFDEVTS